MRETRRVRRGAASVLVVLVALLALCSRLNGDFFFGGIAGPGAGETDAPSAIAANLSSGEVYVADNRRDASHQNNRVDVFAADGSFLRAFGWDVIPAGGAGDTGTGLETCTAVTGCKAAIPGSGSGQFSGPTAIAVDNSCALHSPPLTEVTSPTCGEYDPASGDVYIFDSTNARIQRFHPNGNLVLMLGKEVNKTKVDEGAPAAQRNVCTAISGDLCQAGKSGSGAGQFEASTQVTVGSGGTVFTADKSHIQRFDLAGTPGTECPPVSSSPPAGIAVDASGNTYVAIGQEVRKLDPACNPLATIDPSPGFPNINAIALDAAGNLFVADKSTFNQTGGAATAVYEYNTAGALIHTLYGNGTLQSGPISLAPYSDASGDLFAVESSSPRRLVHYLIEPPGPVVLPFETKAEPIGNLTATFKARINPEGKATTVHFQYVDGESYDKEGGFASPHTHVSTESASIGNDFKAHNTTPFSIACPNPEENLQEKLEEGECLLPSTEYHFRAVATDSTPITTNGAEETFETLPPIQLGPAWSTAVGTDSARLHAELNPTGIAAEVHFEYVDDAAYQQDIGGGGDGFANATQTPAIDFGSGTSKLSKSALIFPLSPGTTYHYRYIAHDFFGDFTGPERTFSTLPENAEPKSCPNQPFRVGSAANLPDCRAYEMVSPLDKDGGDIAVLNESSLTALGFAPARLDQASSDGEGLSYAAARGFGGVESVPFASQYLAWRDPSAGWLTEPVDPPREGVSLIGGGSADGVIISFFRAFSENLCSAWFVQDTDLALVPGAPAGVPNLYRRENCGEGGYELIPPVKPPGFGKEAEQAGNYRADLGGFTPDGAISTFKAPAALTPEASTVAIGAELTCIAPGESPEFKWLRNGKPIVGATSSTYTTKTTSSTTPPTTTGDAGGVIQCQVFAGSVAAGATQVANPATVVAPFPVSAPPIAPVKIPAPTSSAPLVVGGGGGQTLSCDAREDDWEGSPSSFAYQWYRNKVPIAGATASTYLTTGVNLATAANFQCAVSATSAGGTVTRVSANLLTSSPPPSVTEPQPRVLDIYRVYLQHEGALHLVSVLPSGNAAMTHASVGTALGESGKRLFDSVFRAVSQDGSRVFWSAQVAEPSQPAHTGPGKLAGKSKLYLRLNAEHEQSAVNGSEECIEAEKACTIAISSGATLFRQATPNASKAIFSEDEDLFELDVAKAAAYEAGAKTLIAGQVKGLLGASEDLSRVYLVSAEDRDGAGPASAGEFNLYLYEVGGGFTFIATLLNTGWLASPSASDHVSSDVRSISPFPVNRSSRVSADGQQAVFMSDSPELSEEAANYDNTDAASGEADSEVYLYDAAEGELRCISCNPSGARPLGEGLSEDNGKKLSWAAASIPGWETQWHASRVLSASGKRLFFESFEGLVSRDTNGRRDVYEWERADSAKECKEDFGAELFAPKSGGCLSLISSGKSAGDAEFIDASDSGSDVFFTTPASLLPQDYGLIDMYDARAEGGFPLPPEPVPPCEGEACQSPPSPPQDPTPASFAFHGQGNVNEAAKKPKKHKHKHKKRHKRHHRRGHR